VSNYYEILGVWRDASQADIELSAQTLFEHWQAALALHDPIASDWLQIIEQARNTLIDPPSREAYDRALAAAAEREEEEAPVYSPGFPWRPYLCALLAVPVRLATFVLILAVIANSASLTDADAFRDALLTTMLVSSAVAFSCGLVVLVLATQGRREQHRLRVLELEKTAGPAILAQIETAGRLSEYTDVAVWVTWGTELVVTGLWAWFAVLLVMSV
jgi:hypothetical protein